MANETKKRTRRPNTPPEERKKILEKYNELIKGGMKKGEAAKAVGFSQASLYQWQKPKNKPTSKVKTTKKRGRPKKNKNKKRGRPTSKVKSTKKRSTPKKKRGRPKSAVKSTKKRGRGRPKGSKNSMSKKAFLKSLERLIKRFS